MIDVLALNRVLPAISIQTDRWFTRIHGSRFDGELSLLMPPAGWSDPAIDAAELFTFALVEAGLDRADAEGEAARMAEKLFARLPLERRPVMLDNTGSARERVCAAVSDGLNSLFAMGKRTAAVAQAIQGFAGAAALAPAFTLGEFDNDHRSLRELGPGPLQSGLTEFWPGIGWDLAWRLCEDGNTPAEGKMRAWVDGMRPEIEALEKKVGTQLFYFADPDDDCDDDEAHRFLALDYVCHMIPDSPFVAYLAQVSGAPSLDALRHALRSPDAYSSEFRLFNSFLGPQVDHNLEFWMPAAGRSG